MKNTQNGFVGIVIVVIVVLLIGVGGTYVALNKNTTVESTATYNNDESVTQPETDVDQPKNSNVNVEQNISVNNNVKDTSQGTLTDSEVLSATYKISANFGGVKTPSASIIFPKTTSSTRLSGTVYLDKSGTTVNSMSENLEAFWISGYKYTDSSRTEAKVFIGGNFGASGYDDRAFFVSKINGVVTTKETNCNKASNGSCSVDAN
ncbi:MAG: hypothetical protein KBB54_02260 [Candidatus Pacebacteria bacterium]|nr:hypothetical protein [Candidatus Paceibacterota bacterium]MBP9818971.1 hypothetical protein [Candidatus Paceibacterota bacterium]